MFSSCIARLLKDPSTLNRVCSQCMRYNLPVLSSQAPTFVVPRKNFGDSKKTDEVSTEISEAQEKRLSNEAVTGSFKLDTFSSLNTSDVSETNFYTFRTHTCGELRIEDVGKTVVLCGWYEFSRFSRFITLRDGYGSTQIIIPKNDPQTNNVNLKNIPFESILLCHGIVHARPNDQINDSLETGLIEVVVNKLEVLNLVKTSIPFQIRNFNKANESIRLKHRYVDLRFPEMQRNLRLRSSVLMKMREFLINSRNFVEVETPTLFKKTPGGAQEFIVPTHDKGKCYSLVQSPQQLKQMLMVGSIDRYFQIAKCYRDEATRPDRQPEFTQLDIEMSFTDQNGVLRLVEELLSFIWPKELGEIKTPFPRMSYDEAMKNYGSDKPDMRNQAAESSDTPQETDNANRWRFIWIVDFPLFEQDSETGSIQSVHHPFTQPQEQITDDNLLKVKGYHYDLVLNGCEVGGGSIRIHDADLQTRVIESILKIPIHNMSHLIEALKSGCPPHGGIALGIDRLMSILCSTNSIRDVIAFPKTFEGKDLLTGAPSEISAEDIERYLKF
ncbi:aspartate--tRNA ligase, mitochondrial [Adelges cooleyi]|uniref:aspartate--tRNA ligase, mitochondrial n=1 Tax=Adelges cooleyi TaxID=133065 RepID=UPI00217F9ABF|nr:aspartate--tRNA ligase, mitochondrial [Adelges cooleyi]